MSYRSIKAHKPNKSPWTTGFRTPIQVKKDFKNSIKDTNDCFVANTIVDRPIKDQGIMNNTKER